MKMQFCPYCGAKLDEGAHFCKNCGEAIGNADCAPQGAKHNQRTEKNTSERKVVYEGTIHKCPNCGEVLRQHRIIWSSDDEKVKRKHPAIKAARCFPNFLVKAH